VHYPSGKEREREDKGRGRGGGSRGGGGIMSASGTTRVLCRLRDRSGVPRSAALRQLVNDVKRSAGYPTATVGVWLASPSTMHRLNKKHRGMNKPTDILSFANYAPFTAPEVFPDVEEPVEEKVANDEEARTAAGVKKGKWPEVEKERGMRSRDLGDMVICPAYTKAAAIEDHEWEAEKKVRLWERLVVHGMVHLLGYDHEEEAEAKRMEEREGEIMRGLKDLQQQRQRRRWRRRRETATGGKEEESEDCVSKGSWGLHAFQ
jgi:rRNA maturation RNase YbeY